MQNEPSEAAVVRLMLRELEHAIEQHEQEVRDCDYNLALIENKNVLNGKDKVDREAWRSVRITSGKLADRARVRADALLACLKAAGWALDDLDVTAAG